jgi:RNA polymerase subunit RPABC4/transcription elongation factor Spt4
MFFLVGGVQPKTTTLDQTPRICPVCGFEEALLKRIDHYVSLFFIPVFRVKKGVPVLICKSCGAVSSPDQTSRQSEESSYGKRCPRCGYSLSGDFRYCPGCGMQI